MITRKFGFSIAIAAAVAFGGVSLAAESGAKIYALPEGEPRCELYRVTVDGLDVPVSAARVSAMPVNIRWPGHQREKDQTEIAGFVRFEMSRPVTMTVERSRVFRDVKIRPFSKGVAFKASGRTVTFTLEKPGDYSVEFDGRHENLHVFAHPPSAYAVKKGDPKVRYFGPGVHDAGLIEMKSGETLYVDEGAVVYGRVHARDADDVSILGRGILDMSRIREQPKPIDPKLAEEQKRKGFAITNAKRWDCIRLEYCDRVKIDGITMRDSLIYYVRPIGCRDVEITNVKIIGSWRYNADGIDMHNCERVHVADCFVRTYDDAICIKGFDYAMDESEMLHDGVLHDVFKDVLVERCTFWNDWGLSLEFGAETRAREICGVVWRNCDVIRAHAAACDVQNCDYADIHDVLYEDVRLEFDGFHPRTAYSATAKDFDPTADGGTPAAIRARIHVVPEYSKNDKRRGRIRDVTFRNVRVTAPRQPVVSFAGYDADHRVTGVTIEGFFLNGEDVTEKLDVVLGKFADAPVLRPLNP
ncbi:MAG: glycosyl hydrolase family 28 protein [Kiritimatiellae bacterium]|nr:glycosyl hydrolase family 28 protein [Kiritimatiellia bacterium]